MLHGDIILMGLIPDSRMADFETVWIDNEIMIQIDKSANTEWLRELVRAVYNGEEIFRNVHEKVPAMPELKQQK